MITFVFLIGALATCCMAASAPGGVRVICGKNLHITEAMGVRGDWGGESAWTATAHGDTLVLSRKGQCGDECNYEEKIVLSSLARKCPSLVSASIQKTDFGSVDPKPHIETATHGTLRIQDWEPASGVVSGRLEAEFKLTFFVRTPAPAVMPKQ